MKVRGKVSDSRETVTKRTVPVSTSRVRRENTYRIKVKDAIETKEKQENKPPGRIATQNRTVRPQVRSVVDEKKKLASSTDGTKAAAGATAVRPKKQTIREEPIHSEPKYVDDFEEYESDFEVDLEDKENDNEDEAVKQSDGIDETMYGELQDETGEHLIGEAQGEAADWCDVEERRQSSAMIHEMPSKDKGDQRGESNHEGDSQPIHESTTAGAQHLAGEMGEKKRPPEHGGRDAGAPVDAPHQRSVSTDHPKLNDLLNENSDPTHPTESPVKNRAAIELYRSPGLPYDFFIRAFGRVNYHQKYTQTNVVNDSSCQTDAVILKHQSQQHPSYGTSEDYRSIPSNPIDPFSLLDFLNKSQRIVKAILPIQPDDIAEGRRESRMNTSSSSGRSSVNSTFNSTSSQWTSSASRSFKRYLKIPNGSDKFCSSFYKLLPSMPHLRKYPIKCLSLHGQYLISVQVSTTTDESFLSVWPVKSTSKPESILRVRSIVTCAIASELDEIIFAGTVDGSLHMWSLNSFDNDAINCTSRCSSPLDGESYFNGKSILRYPSFSTFCVPNLTVHKSAIVSIDTINSRRSVDLRRKSEKICSIDENATIALWMVEYSSKLSISYVEQLGDGMSPGSVCRLVLESSLTVKDENSCLGGDSLSGPEPVKNDQVNGETKDDQDRVIKYNRARHDSFYRKIIRRELITVMRCCSSDHRSHRRSQLPEIASTSDASVRKSNISQVSVEHVLVGTSSGIMYQLAPFNESPVRSYTCLTSDGAPFISLVSIDIMRVNMSADSQEPIGNTQLADGSLVILTGYADGTLALFHENISSPLITWDASHTQINSIITVKWLSNSSFAVLDEFDCLLLWDLSVTMYTPLLKYQLSKVTCMQVKLMDEQSILFGTEEGHIEVICLNENFTSNKSLWGVLNKLMATIGTAP